MPTFLVVDPPDHFDANFRNLRKLGALDANVFENFDHPLAHTHSRVLQTNKIRLFRYYSSDFEHTNILCKSMS
jgi:hypothetical protein